MCFRFKILFYFILFFAAQHIHSYEIYFREKDWGQHTFLVSYPRNGNTWMRYSLEFLTKRPTIRLLNKSEKINNEIPEVVIFDTETQQLHLPISNSIPLGVDYAKPPILKVHSFRREYSLEKFSPSTQALYILLIRNPKECLLRESTLEQVKSDIQTAHFNYFENLKIYHNWNPQKRKLIYYEDLISNPYQVFNELLEFLGESKQYLDEFMANYDNHRQSCLNHYHAMGHQSHSKGQTPLFYSTNLSKEERISIDQLIEQEYPVLWREYLLRYSENH